MTDYRATSYAPLAIDDRDRALTTTVLSTPIGTIVARHSPARASSHVILFLHGAAGAWTTWTPLLRAADIRRDDLGDIALLDLPGWGDAELTARATTIDVMTEAVRDAALALGYTEWTVVGHSMGGLIALHLAAIDPHRTRSVLAVSPTLWSVFASVEHPVRRFWTLPAFTMLWRVLGALSLLPGEGRGVVRAAHRIGLLRAAVSPLFRHPGRIDQSVVAGLADEIRPRAFRVAAEVVRGYDPEQRWAPIECPVTAVRGDADVFVRADDLAALSRVLPHARTIEVDDCGHYGPAERPFVVLDALRSL